MLQKIPMKSLSETFKYISPKRLGHSYNPKTNLICKSKKECTWPVQTSKDLWNCCSVFQFYKISFFRSKLAKLLSVKLYSIKEIVYIQRTISIKWFFLQSIVHKRIKKNRSKCAIVGIRYFQLSSALENQLKWTQL